MSPTLQVVVWHIANNRCIRSWAFKDLKPALASDSVTRRGRMFVCNAVVYSLRSSKSFCSHHVKFDSSSGGSVPAVEMIPPVQRFQFPKVLFSAIANIHCYASSADSLTLVADAHLNDHCPSTYYRHIRRGRFWAFENFGLLIIDFCALEASSLLSSRSSLTFEESFPLHQPPQSFMSLPMLLRYLVEIAVMFL